MTFANPHWFCLLLGLPLVLLLFWQKGKEKRMFEQRYQRFLGFLPAPKLFVLQTLCFVLGLAAVIVSLARPRLGYTMMPVKAFAHELIFALDVSQSMLAEDIKPNRLEAAKRKIKDLTKALPGQKIGVVLFAGSAYTYLPVTADYEALHSFMEFAAPDLLSNQGSNYYAALRSALEALQQGSKKEGSNDQSQASKTVMLLSDGEQQKDVDFSRLIDEFKQEHIRFYSLTIGTAVGAPIPDGEGGFKTYEGEVVISKADPQALASLAQEFDGQSFVYSADGSDVRSMAQNVKLHIDSARQASLEERRIWNETFQWFLLAGIGLLFIALLSEAYTKAVEVLLVVLLVGATCAYGSRAWAADQRGINLKDTPTAQQEAEHVLDLLPRDVLMQLLFNAGVEQLEVALQQPPAAMQPGNPTGNQPANQQGHQLGGDPLKNAAQAFLAVTEKYESGASPKLWRDAMFNLGHALAHLKDIDQAIAVYQQLLKRFPEDGPARRNLEYLQRLAENQPEQPQQQNQQQDQQQGQQDKQQQEESSQGNGQDEDSKQQQADKPEQSEQGQQEEKDSSQSQDKQSEDQSKSQQEPDQESDQEPGGEATQDESDQKSDQKESMNSDEKEEETASNHNQADQQEAQEERADVARGMTDKPQERTQKESVEERMTRGLLNLIPERVLPPGALEQAPDQSQEETTRDW